MALKNMRSTTMTVLVVMLMSIIQVKTASSFEFQVGWAVPPANDTKFYNDWASENRFQPGDALRFRYKKDSVMEVAETDYKQCNSTHPSFFSNNGNTVFSLERSGPFYFISGVSGHCRKGQRMIVKVLAPPEDHGHDHHDHDPKTSSSPASSSSAAFSGCSVALFLLCALASSFHISF